MLGRVALLSIALAAGGTSCGRPPAAASEASASATRPARDALVRAAAWLWAQQAEDGGWHSATYGLLRSGQSLTPFALSALLLLPEDSVPAPPGAVRRALEFVRARLRSGGDEDGALGRADPTLPDYPNYATSLALLTFARARARGIAGPGADDAIRRMAACLRRQQFAEDRGWRESDPAYGGWGMGGALRRPPDSGHVDLSMTRFALQALAASGAGPGDPAFRRAARFLARVKNDDGGFVFSPVELGGNKAGPKGLGFRSYGTATADGLLSLLAMGVPPSDPRVEDACAWLSRRHSSLVVPGFPVDVEAPWETGMVHYYRAASAAALAALGVAEAPAGRDWRGDLAEALTRAQRADGSFRNESFLMKEDDPLIATTFALRALASTDVP